MTSGRDEIKPVADCFGSDRVVHRSRSPFPLLGWGFPCEPFGPYPHPTQRSVETWPLAGEYFAWRAQHRAYRDQVPVGGRPPAVRPAPVGRRGAGQQPRHTRRAGRSEPSAARGTSPGSAAVSAAIRSRIRSTHIEMKDGLGAVPSDRSGLREYRQPLRSLSPGCQGPTTSMWSLTKPIGTMTTCSTPSAPRASGASLTSGSSHAPAVVPNGSARRAGTAMRDRGVPRLPAGSPPEAAPHSHSQMPSRWEWSGR